MRRGMSLVECLVAIAVTSIILSTVALSLNSMYRVNRGAQERIEQSLMLHRLSARLRDDAHQATGASINKTDDALSPLLVLTNFQTVEYRWESGAVRRLVRENDEVIHRDQFRLPPDAKVQWSLLPAEPKRDRPIARVTVSGIGESGTGETTIDAVVGSRR